MKKNFTVYALALSCAAISLFSCNKKAIEVPTPQEENFVTATANREGDPDSVSVSPRGYLVFASESSYNTALSKLATMTDSEIFAWEDGIGHNSLYDKVSDTTYDNTNNINSSVDDKLFQIVVNEAGIVQIGNYIFKASANNGYVTELDQNDADVHYQAFANGDFIENVTNRFAMSEEDAFEKLDGGIRGFNAFPKGTGWFGEDDPYDDTQNPRPGVAPAQSAKCKITYQKAVFYFSLLAKMKYMWQVNPFFWSQWNTDMRFYNIRYRYDPKGSGSAKNVSGASSSATNVSVHEYYPYSGSRGLKDGWTMEVDMEYVTVFGYTWRTVPHHFHIGS